MRETFPHTNHKQTKQKEKTMQALFTITYLTCVLIAPVLVVVLLKSLYVFFTQDLDEFDQWQDDEPIGAYVLISSKYEEVQFERYVSFGTWDEEKDTDSYGVPDINIYHYLDYCCDRHVLGCELSDGEFITHVLDWEYISGGK